MEKKISIACDPDKRLRRIALDDLNVLQGDLKEMTRARYEKFAAKVQAKGITFALHVWFGEFREGGKKWWLLDGTGRKKMLTQLRDDEEFEVPDLPCVEVPAETYAEAKRLVLDASSQYHMMTKQGLYEFMEDEIGIDEIADDYALPDIDEAEFRQEFFEDAADEEDGPAKSQITFDAYQNAAIKQIVLYFPKDEYEKMIAKLDALVQKWDLEDYSQVIWRLANEANPT